MSTVTNIAFNVLRISWLVQIALGLLFWTGNALSLVPIHMWNGYLLVILLWALALLAARAGSSAGLVALAIVWGIIVPFVGLNQARWMPGDFHWVVQVIHLLLGIGVAGIGEALAARIRQSVANSAAPAPARAD
jgi:hypothetical protein